MRQIHNIRTDNEGAKYKPPNNPAIMTCGFLFFKFGRFIDSILIMVCHLIHRTPWALT